MTQIHTTNGYVCGVIICKRCVYVCGLYACGAYVFGVFVCGVYVCGDVCVVCVFFWFLYVYYVCAV